MRTTSTTRLTSTGGRGLKTYSVGYYLDQGFRIEVTASSPAEAERIVRRRLDRQSGELPSSTRLAYDDGVTGAREVCP